MNQNGSFPIFMVIVILMLVFGFGTHELMDTKVSNHNLRNQLGEENVGHSQGRANQEALGGENGSLRGGADSLGSEWQAQQARCDQVEQERRALQEKYDQAEQELKDVQTRYEQAQQDLKALQTSYDQAQQELQAVTEQKRDLQIMLTIEADKSRQLSELARGLQGELELAQKEAETALTPANLRRWLGAALDSPFWRIVLLAGPVAGLLVVGGLLGAIRNH